MSIYDRIVKVVNYDSTVKVVCTYDKIVKLLYMTVLSKYYS